ncbi:MAG: CoA-binding protein [Candidatus Zixiibacteriota bacterium]|nr:MAG: CoA-binding protein [candidate division Zixibacteria bacterium]
MNEDVTRFLGSHKIAVVGVSSSRLKFGSIAFRALKGKGYQVLAVNSHMDRFEGQPCYSSLASLPEPVDAALITVKPSAAAAVVDDASEAGVRRLWFQDGADFSKAAERAGKAGLETVTGKCILLYAEPVTGIHRVHRFLAKLFGRY